MIRSSRRLAIAAVPMLTILPALGAHAEPAFTQISVPNGEILNFSADGNWLLAQHLLPSDAG
jgi:hypothetical protein